MSEFNKTLKELWEETPKGEHCICKGVGGNILQVLGVDDHYAVGKYIIDSSGGSVGITTRGDNNARAWMRYQPNPKTKTYYRPKMIYYSSDDTWEDGCDYRWYPSKEAWRKTFKAEVADHNWEEKEFPVQE